MFRFQLDWTSGVNMVYVLVPSETLLRCVKQRIKVRLESKRRNTLVVSGIWEPNYFNGLRTCQTPQQRFHPAFDKVYNILKLPRSSECSTEAKKSHKTYREYLIPVKRYLMPLSYSKLPYPSLKILYSLKKFRWVMFLMGEWFQTLLTLLHIAPQRYLWMIIVKQVSNRLKKHGSFSKKSDLPLTRRILTECIPRKRRFSRLNVGSIWELKTILSFIYSLFRRRAP